MLSCKRVGEGREDMRGETRLSLVAEVEKGGLQSLDRPPGQLQHSFQKEVTSAHESLFTAYSVSEKDMSVWGWLYNPLQSYFICCLTFSVSLD
jgi:hypothetical protein